MTTRPDWSALKSTGPHIPGYPSMGLLVIIYGTRKRAARALRRMRFERRENAQDSAMHTDYRRKKRGNR